ncbi:MAG: META domain-containing protein [Alphaproteobacteria bacterium]|jgi:heat shock protein HslJ
MGSGGSLISLAGTEWGYAGETGKTSQFIQFRPDGTVVGFTGCNRFTGPYGQAGDALTIGPLATTRRACLPEVTKREKQFLGVLNQVRQVEGSRRVLKLKDADGDILAELVRREPDK